MKAYREQQIVGPGWYFNPRHLAFRSIDEEQPLNGKPGQDYYKVPLLATILISPFIGLVYFFFLPITGFVMLGNLLAKKAAVQVRRGADSVARVLAPSWQPARAFLSTSKARSARQGNHDEWADEIAGELGVDAPIPGRHVHISRRILIDSPLETTYTVAEDPEHWNDWFVGLSEPRRISGLKFHNRTPNLSVGTHFPLIEKGCKDCREKGAAHWHSRGVRNAETGTLGQDAVMVLLPTVQDWEYIERDGATEVHVEVDVTIPDEGWSKALDAEIVENLEGECFDRTLANLKSLCERSTVH